MKYINILLQLPQISNISFLSLSLPGSRTSSPSPQPRQRKRIYASSPVTLLCGYIFLSFERENLAYPGRQVLLSLTERLNDHIQQFCLHPVRHRPHKKPPFRSTIHPNKINIKVLNNRQGPISTEPVHCSFY